MAQLAIKGHKTRGKEVIEILEMLGGKIRRSRFVGHEISCAYYINEDGYMSFKHYSQFDDTMIFTLEEFLKKFPYKVGDKVSSKYLKNYEISKMKWESINNRVIYKLRGMRWYSADELQPYKEETVEEIDIMDHTTEINLNHPCFKGCNEIEIIIPDGWEFKQRDNKMFGVRKQYPKTYEECYKVLQIPKDESYIDIDVPLSYNKTLKVFTQLLICRNAYWKIAGEQMGLDKPWEPDFTDFNEERYGLYAQANKIVLDAYGGGDVNTILTFPTEEMRDAFYENFKDLIEGCKEFL